VIDPNVFEKIFSGIFVCFINFVIEIFLHMLIAPLEWLRIQIHAF